MSDIQKSLNEWEAHWQERITILETLNRELQNLVTIYEEAEPKYRSERDVLKAENARLLETLDYYSEDYKKIINEECPTDEKHCSCVPVLRQELEKSMELLRHEVKRRMIATEKSAKIANKLAEQKALYERSLLFANSYRDECDRLKIIIAAQVTIDEEAEQKYRSERDALQKAYDNAVSFICELEPQVVLLPGNIKLLEKLAKYRKEAKKHWRGNEKP